jgi:hypothetical protein
MAAWATNPQQTRIATGANTRCHTVPGRLAERTAARKVTAVYDSDVFDLVEPSPHAYWQPEPSVAVVASCPQLRRRIVAALDYDRLPLAAQVDREERLLSAAPARGAGALVIAAASLHEALDVSRRVRDAGLDGYIVAILPEAAAGAAGRALRAGIDGVVTERQIEAALALAVRGTCAGLVVLPRPDLALARVGVSDSHGELPDGRAPW